MDVRIERLGPMRVASVRALSETPEADAWRRLRAWDEAANLLADSERHRLFGFNNPPPEPGRNEYGYELWVEYDGPPEPKIEIKDFAGGRFAVTACRLEGIGEAWKSLWEWAQSNGYRWRRAQELERVRNPLAAEQDLTLELYLPIED